MALVSVWLHLVGLVVWIGGVVYQAHVLWPAARRSGDVGPFVEAARRGRLVSWVAASVVVLTGLYNVTQLGGVERAMQSGAGTVLAAKFILVLVMISLATHRDFAQLPRLAGTSDPAALRTIARLDRAILLLAVVVMYLGLVVSRLGH